MHFLQEYACLEHKHTIFLTQLFMVDTLHSNSTKYLRSVTFTKLKESPNISQYSELYSNTICVSVNAIFICNQVILLGLPAHTTHVLQPLDVGIFLHIKRKYNSLCIATGARSARARITKQHFPTAWNLACKAATVEVIQSAFKRSGLYPFNPTAIDDSKLRKRKLVFKCLGYTIYMLSLCRVSILFCPLMEMKYQIVVRKLIE